MKLMQMKYYRTNEFEKKSEITLVISVGKKNSGVEFSLKNE